jgi:hypothetical protein
VLFHFLYEDYTQGADHEMPALAADCARPVTRHDSVDLFDLDFPESCDAAYSRSDSRGDIMSRQPPPQPLSCASMTQQRVTSAVTDSEAAIMVCYCLSLLFSS